jgi:hypothetical protein
MLALDGEVRGEYFTDDTPLSTVHGTLSEGGFSGYVELSRNVLSGDYYVVYGDGDAEYVGFIGSSNRLITDEEAESKAKNEVGIYSVVAVDLPEPDLPDAADPATAGTGAATTPDDDGGSSATDGAEAGLFEEPDETTTAPDAGRATAAEPDDSGPAAGGPGAETAEETDATRAEGTGAPSTDDTGLGATDEPDETTAVPSLDPERSGPTDAVEADDAGGDATDADAELETTAPAARTTDTTTEGADRPAELDALRSELSSLRRTQERLEERVAALESGGTAESDDGRPATGPSLSPAEALSGTTLFVREGTRGGPTLEDAHAGRADRESLSANVNPEPHTRFDGDGATVDGEPFESFLTGTTAHAFVEWLTTTLPFEIRSTGNEESMRYVYDTLPAVDRVAFSETVTVEDGREATFDAVVRDRMGDPLFVASFEKGPDPTSAAAIEPFITDASDLCAVEDSLGGAFVVTGSYFDSDGLELVREATSRSLLSRDKHRSLVSLTRKNGYHLCLVEARDNALYMTVPEL